MSQGDQSIANQAGAAYRADLNAELQALVSNSSGASEPGTTWAYQFWADTTTNLLKRRNAANGGWLVVQSLDEVFAVARSSNTILGVSDFGKTFIATGTFTQTFTAAATLADGWFVRYRNDGTGVITLDPNSTEQIDGAATRILMPGQSCQIICTGSAFKTVGLQSPSFLTLMGGAQAIAGGDSLYATDNGLVVQSADARIYPPIAGTFSNLYTNISTAPGGAETNTTTMRKNSSPTSLISVITGAAVTGSNTSPLVDVVPGDYIDWLVEASASAVTTAGFALTVRFDAK